MGLSSVVNGFRTHGRRALARRIGIDTRTLAVFRISIGLVLLSDLLLRSRNLVVFYTDSGVLPRAVLEAQFPDMSRLTFHTLSGAVWFQATLFIVAAIFAVSMIVGYRTRISTVFSFVLLMSLQFRNPTLLNSGDFLLWRLLLWSLFLPLGERWSVDALRSDGHDRRIANVATAGILAQVVIVYVANALFKLRGDLWLQGLAVRYVFSLHSLTTPVGDLLANYPPLLVLFDKLWLAMVVTSVLLLLLTGWARAAFVSLFVAMHFGMLLTMHLSIFPLVSITALILFLPSVVWDALARFSKSHTESLDTARWRRRFERTSPVVSTPEIPTSVFKWIRRAVSLVAACLLVSVLVWNAATLGYVQTPDSVNEVANPVAHRWSMFAPEPWGTDGWFVVPGTLESGRRVDAFRQSSVRWERPSDASLGFPTHRWQKYLLAVQSSGYWRLPPAFTRYVCRQWNESHDDDLVNVSVYYVRQPTNLDGEEPTHRVKITDRSCGTRNQVSG
ncbi:HTTM domain-containing protein [Haladaptatus sp. DYF46]|uniref:HTTM domain-containing protein n=1 Tax=Haladaptatus sp. DYF46 TaxID=2886041 RepID=UPI001E49F0AB|nr:HTTM domain-containing protein [Haladaptatus sp. DYF46]